MYQTHYEVIAEVFFIGLSAGAIFTLVVARAIILDYKKRFEEKMWAVINRLKQELYRSKKLNQEISAEVERFTSGKNEPNNAG